MKLKITKITIISIIIILILNFLIIFTGLRYIEYAYIGIFLLYNLYFIGIAEEKYHKNSYNKLKEIVKTKINFFVVINILIFFYIFKEPYFFLSKYKILILLGSIILGYSSLIFLQKIKIKLSLNFFKEIIKIFLVSGIIYYFPIVCTDIFWLFVEYYWKKLWTTLIALLGYLSNSVALKKFY